MSVKTLQFTCFFFFLIVITSNINALTNGDVVRRLENMLHFLDISNEEQLDTARTMKKIHNFTKTQDPVLVPGSVITLGLQNMEYVVFHTINHTVFDLATLALSKYKRLSKINKKILYDFLEEKDQNKDGTIKFLEFISFNNDWSSKYFKNVEVDEKPTFNNIKDSEPTKNTVTIVTV
ncbi:uncharacterized protein LOC126893540 isoform X2 [Daktulosphaira vitifoliae]|uniref:uncharacterized protein LOC126893540 isoform X2 n=1 Tax=Daktulosphaira vitifoliae TaxID=58002 RepID=UPI0021A99407|nr:uncharacterized protein LOC126893540 isoform X2 [Daktulosphaira vitifoliae]